MPILEALVCETHAAALLAATIASAVNAFRRHDTERSERELKPYVPSEPALISVLRSHMLEADLDPDTVAVIVGFFDDLGPARVALNHYFSDANKLGDERASALHLLTLSNAWQRACDDALARHPPVARLPRTAARPVHEQLQGYHGGAADRDARRLTLPRRQRQDRPPRSAPEALGGAAHDLPAVHHHLQSHDRRRLSSAMYRPAASASSVCPRSRRRPSCSSSCPAAAASPASWPGARTPRPACASPAPFCPTTRCYRAEPRRKTRPIMSYGPAEGAHPSPANICRGFAEPGRLWQRIAHRA